MDSGKLPNNSPAPASAGQRPSGFQELHKQRGRVDRKDGRHLRRHTIYLPVDLADKLRAKAADDDRFMNELVVEAVEKYLADS
jgi:hypothetical protein